eukprot:324760_1
MSLPNVFQQSESSLCAIFDFDTFVLDSKMLSARELAIQQRNLTPNQTISNKALQEYVPERNRITISLITLPSHCLRHLRMIKVPCLGRTTPIYIEKIKPKGKDPKRNECFVRISTVKPKTATAHRTTQWEMKYNAKGMIFAIIFKTDPDAVGSVIDGIYYHAHGSTPYVPRPRSSKNASGSRHPFVPDTENAIVSTESLKHYGTKSKAKKHKKRRRSLKGIRVCESDLGPTKLFSLSSSSPRSIESVNAQQTSPLMDA